VCGLLRVFSKY